MTATISPILTPPSGLVLPKRLQTAMAAAQLAQEGEKADPLPRPQGYKLLCVTPEIAEKFDDSSIVRPEISRQQEEHGTAVLFVLRMGPDAYKDETKFPTGPWCKEGDWVVVRTYSGTRLKIFGKEFRIIHDDMVEAVVDDPRGVGRA